MPDSLGLLILICLLALAAGVLYLYLAHYRVRRVAPPPEPWRDRVPAGRLNVNARNLSWWAEHRNSEMGFRALCNRRLEEIVDLDRRMDDLREGRP